MAKTVNVAVEAADKKVFVSALDWPGWSRSGKTEEQAIESLLEHAPRYAVVAKAAGLDFDADGITIDPVERDPGDASTTFGVPGAIGEADRRPVSAAEAKRLGAIVEAAWNEFDRVAAKAPESLRKGPRGGGRDRSKIVEHVNGSDEGYANVMGIKGIDDVAGRRKAVLEVLCQPSDGSPLAGKRWPPRWSGSRWTRRRRRSTAATHRSGPCLPMRGGGCWPGRATSRSRATTRPPMPRSR
jgi:hypothetical protein